MNNEPLKDLELIKRMVTESQGLFSFGSIYFILWGIIVPIATTGMLIADINGAYELIGPIWAIVCTLGGIISAIIGSKAKIPHKTLFTSLYGVVWLSLSFGYFMAIISLFFNLMEANISLCIIAMLLAVGHIIGGYMHKSKALIISGIIWYLISMFLIIFKFDIMGYVMGFAPLFISLIPGIILRKANG